MMNYLIFMLVIAMCFDLNVGCIWCTSNILEVQNRLNPVKELGVGNRIVWRCTLRHGDKVKSSVTIWRAYRGASQARNGEKRSWIARPDGIYLEKNNKVKGLEHHWIVTKQ
ncbi:hypothetical protein N665_0751s0027 [Sinapis alba]|nr:hypothetical protein N665_0751s0027 [Sinapis alba]